MNTTTQQLPGIKAIYCLDARRLQQNIALRYICGMNIIILAELTPVEFYGDPACKCETEFENAAMSQTATLEFKAVAQLPGNMPLAFVVTAVDGRSYLIGSRESPRAVAKCERVMAAPSGEASVCKYEVTHKATRTLIPCIF